ncbi:glutathione S-transferase N-terminal domain-containing protein [Marinobacter sp. SS21]|uniref:glutathione S-transferase N-terminal domain-containing protein n=1 Tax=Marinobacter sp. SS21 TaxID=2979460 RepID=UPI00232F0D23|nr:glutathione S-transferase N-terminal domain-containing protein [Marinobacter sp. SS21]MDC0662370.1 glutathione S-transferase N-terminal domain-containing protein [Marinobacter sp. SS21]
MKLFYSATSPFARKVLVCATEHGLSGQLELIQAHPIQNADQVAAVTPLGKVPALQTESGRVIVDSPLICEYLDRLAVAAGKQSLMPSLLDNPNQAEDDARLHALADGIMDAAYLYVMESNRPTEQQSAMWQQRWTEAVRRTLAFLEDAFRTTGLPAGLSLGGIALGCALGYLDFRLADLGWRDSHPALADFYGPLSARTSFLESAPTS